MTPVPRRLVACRARLGESPLWHPQEQRLYWVDIDGKHLYRCRADGSDFAVVLHAGPIGGITLQADGRLVLLMEAGSLRVFENGKMRDWQGPHPLLAGRRWNDALADPAGRVFSGSIAASGQEGIFGRIDLDGSIHRIRGNIGCSNGLGLSPDGKIIYHTDSHAREIRAYDYDLKTGAVTGERIFARFPAAAGLPDGLALDAEGCVWSAFWDGACIRRLNPAGQEILKVALPAQRITSLTFGGPERTDIFITTAGGDDPAAYGAEAGNLFHLNLGIAGREIYRSRLLIP